MIVSLAPGTSSLNHRQKFSPTSEYKDDGTASLCGSPFKSDKPTSQKGYKDECHWSPEVSRVLFEAVVRDRSKTKNGRDESNHLIW